jgi:hypothetical protein
MRTDHARLRIAGDSDGALPRENDIQDEVAGLDVEDPFVADLCASDW